MNQRTTPSAKRDDDAFPVRIKLAVPSDGLGKTLDEIAAWLRDNFARDDFAIHSARTNGGDAMGVYFLGIEDAGRFLAAFPNLPLATAGRPQSGAMIPWPKR